MRSRTLERMRWLSVLCLAGAAMCFAQSAKWERAVSRDSLVLPAPAPGASVNGHVTVWQRQARTVEMLVPVAKSDVGKSSSRERPPMPAALRIEFTHESGAKMAVDINRFDFLAAIDDGTIGLYESLPFDLPKSGHYAVSVSAASDDVHPGQLLQLNFLNPGMGYFWVSDFIAQLAWVSFAIGAALWIALAFARRYAPSDARR